MKVLFLDFSLIISYTAFHASLLLFWAVSLTQMLGSNFLIQSLSSLILFRPKPFVNCVIAFRLAKLSSLSCYSVGTLVGG